MNIESLQLLLLQAVVVLVVAVLFLVIVCCFVVVVVAAVVIVVVVVWFVLFSWLSFAVAVVAVLFLVAAASVVLHILAVVVIHGCLLLLIAGGRCGPGSQGGPDLVPGFQRAISPTPGLDIVLCGSARAAATKTAIHNTQVHSRSDNRLFASQPKLLLLEPGL